MTGRRPPPDVTGHPGPGPLLPPVLCRKRRRSGLAQRRPLSHRGPDDWTCSFVKILVWRVAGSVLRDGGPVCGEGSSSLRGLSRSRSPGLSSALHPPLLENPNGNIPKTTVPSNRRTRTHGCQNCCWEPQVQPPQPAQVHVPPKQPRTAHGLRFTEARRRLSSSETRPCTAESSRILKCRIDRNISARDKSGIGRSALLYAKTRDTRRQGGNHQLQLLSSAHLALAESTMYFARQPSLLYIKKGPRYQ